MVSIVPDKYVIIDARGDKIKVRANLFEYSTTIGAMLKDPNIYESGECPEIVMNRKSSDVHNLLDFLSGYSYKNNCNLHDMLKQIEYTGVRPKTILSFRRVTSQYSVYCCWTLNINGKIMMVDITLSYFGTNGIGNNGTGNNATISSYVINISQPNITDISIHNGITRAYGLYKNNHGDVAYTNSHGENVTKENADEIIKQTKTCLNEEPNFMKVFNLFKPLHAEIFALYNTEPFDIL